MIGVAAELTRMDLSVNVGNKPISEFSCTEPANTGNEIS